LAVVVVAELAAAVSVVEQVPLSVAGLLLRLL
jgi:hypothetical protein